MAAPYLVLVGGTTRPGSSTEQALRFVARELESAGATTRVFAGDELSALPLFAPESPDRTPEAKTLVEELRRADGIVLGTPAYHGSISGLVKNALDYTEDLRSDERPYLSGRPVGCVSTGAGWQGVVAALEHLRTVVHTLRGWPTPLGAAINTATKVFTPDGDCTDEKAAFQLQTVAAEVLGFVARG